jgi:hypothetical protein
MKRLSLLSGILLLFFAISSCTGSANYYVSPQGNDSNPGTQAKPFKTIEHASDFLQAGDTCFLLGGNYHQHNLLANLNGEKDLPIVFTSLPGEEAVMDGSVLIDGDWKVHKGNIYQLKLQHPVWQLFVDGSSISSARWPNGNWNDGSIWDKKKSMSWPEKGKGGPGHHFNEELKELDFSMEDGGIMVVNSGSFKTYKTFVTAHNAGSNEIKYDRDRIQIHFSYEDRIERFGYFLEGKKELIDVENEWFFEPEDSMLYVYFEEGTSPANHEVRGKNISYAIELEACSNIVFRDIDFFASTVKVSNSSFITLEDSRFKFPSYSKRMLRDLSPLDVTQMLVKNEFTESYDTIRNCVFAYADGPALDLNGVGNLVENCFMHHIDYSCTYKGGWTLNMIDAPDLVFRRNTIHTTGASETYKAGRRNLIELNDISNTGHLQNDGSMVQVSVKQQDQSITRYNWVHNSMKQGLRYDNSNKPNSPWGENGTLHHNVAWATDRIFFKGDKHFIYNNLVFDSHLNDLIISSDTIIQGWNYETITRNNISNKFSASRTKPGKDYPVPGIVDHNWSGNFKGADVRSQLRDPDNLDFRPKKGSEIIDAGEKLEGKEIDFIGSAPDIGPYEYGDPNYRIPGYQADRARRPIPPNEAVNVKTDADLMWMEGYKSNSHHVYFGTDPEKVELANENSDPHKGRFSNNIFSPGDLIPGHTYYWRVDVVREDLITKGRIWSFTVENDLAQK